MTWAGRSDVGSHRADRRVDGGNMVLLVAAAFVLFLIPTQLAFGTQGLSFRIPSAIGLLGLLLAGCHLLVARGDGRWKPPIVALLGYGAYAAFQYGRAQFVPAGSTASAPLRSLLIGLGSIGLGLLASTTLTDRERLRTLLVWLASGAYLSAGVAMGQKLFGINYGSLWSALPGLQNDNLGSRTVNLLSGRAYGTAGHPIELSVVSVAMFAFALHLASHHPTRGGRQYHAAGSVLLLFAGFLAISRSGFIALIVVLVVRFAYTGVRQRLNLVAAVVVGVVVTESLSPSALSTLRYQLAHIGTDNSSKGRTQDYGPAFAQWHEHIWLGTGFGVPSPANARFLDNAWLGLLANGGLVAVLLLATVFGVTIGQAMLWAHRAVRTADDPELHSVASCIVAAAIALLISAFFFDELSFFQAQTLVFLLPGVIAAAPFGSLRLDAARIGPPHAESGRSVADSAAESAAFSGHPPLRVRSGYAS